MQSLRYSINITLDGCCDHRAGIPDADTHHHAMENIAAADRLLFGRITYEMMESAWRPSAETGAIDGHLYANTDPTLPFHLNISFEIQ